MIRNPWKHLEKGATFENRAEFSEKISFNYYFGDNKIVYIENVVYTKYKDLEKIMDEIDRLAKKNKAKTISLQIDTEDYKEKEER